MSQTYNSFVIDLANMLVVDVNDPGYQTALPNIIDDSEQRCYRELDLLSTIIRDQSGSLTPNSRLFNFPQHMIVSESINVFTPSGAISPTSTRSQLVPVSREWIDAVWGNVASTTPSVPRYYAMLTDQSILVGPAPDAAYPMEVIGTIRPAPLSFTNQTTYLSLYLPDLFLAGALVFSAGYQQNFSAAADNPQQGVSWEQHFAKLLTSANTEEQRKRYASQAWSPKQPAPLATPPRA